MRSILIKIYNIVREKSGGDKELMRDYFTAIIDDLVSGRIEV